MLSPATSAAAAQKRISSSIDPSALVHHSLVPGVVARVRQLEQRALVLQRSASQLLEVAHFSNAAAVVDAAMLVRCALSAARALVLSDWPTLLGCSQSEVLQYLSEAEARFQRADQACLALGVNGLSSGQSPLAPSFLEPGVTS